jgi:hypothetical protein
VRLALKTKALKKSLEMNFESAASAIPPLRRVLDSTRPAPHAQASPVNHVNPVNAFLRKQFIGQGAAVT